MTPRFPDLDGRRLDGLAMRLPADLPATALLLVAFHQWHQRDVDAWLARVPAGVPAFEVPMLGGRWLPARRFIDGGMARSIADEVVLARTVTVYGQVGVVRDAFELADTELVVAAVVTPDGAVLAEALGPPTDAAATALVHALDAAGG
jgi:hypothetical protein